MKNFGWLLILLLVTGNIVSCGPGDRAQGQSQDNSETSAGTNDTNSSETLAGTNDTDSSGISAETDDTDSSEREGSRNFPLSVFNLLIVILLSVGGFLRYAQLKSWIDTERRKSRDFRKRSSETINELNRNVQNLAFQTQSLKEQFKELKKQVSSSNSKSSFPSSRFQDKQQYPVKDERDYSNYPVYKQYDPVALLDPYQEVITAFNNQHKAFFTENEIILLIPKPQYKNTQKTEFIQIKELSKAIFISIQINQDYLLVPNFMLSRYDQLETAYTGTKVFNNNNYEKGLAIKKSGTNIFEVYGYGEDLVLKKPAKIQKIDDNTWQLEKTGVYVGEDADIEILTEAFNEQDNAFFQKQEIFPVAISQESLQTQTNKNHEIQFQQVENHRDAEFIVLKIDQRYLLIPDFLSPYYSQLNWLAISGEIFQYNGQGDLVTLIKPAEVKEEKDGIWTLIQPGNCSLIKSS